VRGIATHAVDRLAAHPTWWRLLHVTPGEGISPGKPAIITPAFYLSDSAPLSPRAELLATLTAFAQAASSAPVSSPDDDPRCRYPARLRWLSRMLPDTVGRLERGDCPALRTWLDVEAVESVSLVHVSGYFASPASAFGHLLLRVELDGAGGARGLRDLGINFGAAVPPGDGPLVYVLKGLFGGYEAGFSDQAFHAHDAVYSAVEQRDMWAYRLALDAETRSLLLYHLWELGRARFGYYFLRHNCAWYLAALLELGLERPVRARTPWQLPRTVFETLDTLETADGQPLVESVTFVPSLERQFRHGFGELDVDEARRANALIASVSPPEAFARELDDTSTGVLDVLLDRADLGALGGDETTRTRWVERKRAVLRERLRRPIGEPRTRMPPLPPPARGPRSLTFAIGAAHDTGVDAPAVTPTTLRFAPYAYDILNLNRGSLADAEFRLFDLALGGDAEGEARLRSLELIGVEKLATPAVRIAGRSRRVWRAAARVHGERTDCANCSRVVASAGFGFADGTLAAPLDLTLYAYADLELGSERTLFGPSIGALYRPFPRLALRLEGRRLAASEGDALSVVRLGAFASLTRQYGVSLLASRRAGRTLAAFELSRRF